MNPGQIARVAVEGTAYHFDKAYDYQIPPGLQGRTVTGCRVLVPFGGGNRTRQGIIVEVLEESERWETCKPIHVRLSAHYVLTLLRR